MAIVERIKKIFTKDSDSNQDLASTTHASEEATAERSKPAAKPKHGEDGVCCGGCS